MVQRWLETGVQGRAIHAALKRELDYGGSYSAVMRLIRRLEAEHPPEVTVRLTWAPAEAVQVDFGAGPMLTLPDGRLRRTWAFVMTLADSRHQYVEFVWDQTVATWLQCHRRAFEWFTGLPKRVVVDNAKCAMVKACSHDPLVQRAYGECAEAYGFRIDACPPHDPQKEGIVESGVTSRRTPAGQWVMDEAGVRDHGTTREKPLALFQAERPLLKPLPVIAPDLGSWHRVVVHRDCHFQQDRAFCSVPFALAAAQWTVARPSPKRCCDLRARHFKRLQ